MPPVVVLVIPPVVALKHNTLVAFNCNANTAGWPRGIGANQGNYCKGGDFVGSGGSSIIQVSDRQYYGGNTLNNGQYRGTGGRGVRSYPN